MKLADWVMDSKPSFIREILKLTADAEVISFAGGLPAPELFPVADIQACYQDVLASEGVRSLQYSASEGDLELRQRISELLEGRSIPAHPDEILLTNGSQHGLDLVAKAFLNPGDVVLVENPTYLGAIQAFTPYRPELVSIESDGEGMIPEALLTGIQLYQPKFVYMMPNFQNPRGTTMSAQRRERLASICAAADVVILEDDPYGELRYEGTSLPGLRYYSDQVIYLGTLSKTVAPGLRLGWMVAPPNILPALKLGLQATCLNISQLTQRVAAKMLKSDKYSAHIEQIRASYRQRMLCMLDAIRTQFPPDTQCTEPQGGLFLWMTLPGGIASRDVLEAAVAQGVAFVPGDPFYVGECNESTLRLNFSNSTEAQIRSGIAKLAGVVATKLQRQHA